MKNYSIPIMFLGGGGYTLKNVARCWTYETSIIADTEVENDLPYNDYIEYFRPDFKLRPQIINSRVCNFFSQNFQQLKQGFAEVSIDLNWSIPKKNFK